MDHCRENSMDSVPRKEDSTNIPYGQTKIQVKNNEDERWQDEKIDVYFLQSS